MCSDEIKSIIQPILFWALTKHKTIRISGAIAKALHERLS